MFTISLRAHHCGVVVSEASELHTGGGASISLHPEERSTDWLGNVLAKLGDLKNKTRIHSLLGLLSLVPLSLEVPVPLVNLKAFKPTFFSGFLKHMFGHPATVLDVDIHKFAELIVRFAATARKSCVKLKLFTRFIIINQFNRLMATGKVITILLLEAVCDFSTEAESLTGATSGRFVIVLVTVDLVIIR